MSNTENWKLKCLILKTENWNVWYWKLKCLILKTEIGISNTEN
jgi:hypothetical protein